jgi:hypothetical protein
LVNEINVLPNDADVSPNKAAPTETAEYLSAKIQLNTKDYAGMSKFSIENRELFDLICGQELLLGLAYVYPKEKRIFKLFPKVLEIDATLGTNDKKRPLLTITVSNQNGKSFILF